jgi:hypothetical protein
VGVEDHYRLYADKRHFNKADRVLFSNDKPLSKARSAALFQPSEPAQSEQLAILLAGFKTQGIAPVSVTMTPDQNTVDQGRTKLEVVKVLVPDCVPLYFGYGYEPLGMIGEYDSAALFPHPFP